MKKNLTILKTVFLFLFAVFLLQGCRNEDLSASSNSTTEKRAVLIRKVFPKEFQKIKNLNEKFDVSSKKLSQQSFSGKNILDGAVIDSTFAMETTDGKSISYTFAVYRNNQKDYIENLVLQKNVDDTEFKSFLYKYKRKGLIGYDPNTIEVYKIETNTSSNSRMSYIDKTYSNGCYDIIVTTVDCGEGGHHTNGQYCPALGYKVPSDYVTVRNNCSGGGDNDGTDSGYPSGNTGTNGSYGNTGGGGQTATTTPVITTPKWNWGKTSVVNFLGLTSEQLNFINNSAQDEFRAQMLFFISNNGIEDPLANPSEEFLSTEVKALGQWMVNYAMTHSDFLNSEFRNVFLNADLDFLQWSKSFLIQNTNTSWTQFQPMLNFAQEFLSKNPDTINPEQIFNRLKSLDDLSKTNPDILLDIPCSQLPYWKDLANHQIPQQVKDKLKTANSNTHWYNSDLEIQNLDYSKSYTINMDVYPVKISTLPNKPGTNQKFTPAELFNYFRLNINNFTDVNHGKFYPVVDSNIGINDTNLWNSSSPLGSLITIKIPLDEGTVICSGYNSQAWIFTTVKSPWDGEHPVSGNRLFGYYMDGSDMYIYTRGIDRFTSTYSTPEVIRELENLGYSKASDMWKSMQTLLSNFVNNNNGSSHAIQGVDYIPNYIFVKEYLKGQRSINSLGCH